MQSHHRRDTLVSSRNLRNSPQKKNSHATPPTSKNKDKKDKSIISTTKTTGGGATTTAGQVCISTFLTVNDLSAMPSLTSGSGAIKKQQQQRQRGAVAAASSKAASSSSARIKASPGSLGFETNGVNVNGTTGGGGGGGGSGGGAAVSNSTSLSEEEKEKARERNIDMVVFGEIAFKCWYPSYYPMQVLGSEKARGDRDGSIPVGNGIVVDRLYVCGKCFGYSKEVVGWVAHVRCCERDGRGMRGRQVYVHGGAGGKEGNEKGIWSVWEVDGGVDTLFCQNLSLFAKLFLDNKSVFFDVSGFNYFLLVHTSPSTGAQQIVGFFSKEKMSWDNNNLACILIFPPWQRKGLGSILMGVSYEISRREGILGGPEKPISDLGKKGYKRYWGTEIARWLLTVKETDRKKSRGLVDVEKISKETWISSDDCLGVLRDMGVVVAAGRGKGTVERVRIDKVAVREWVERNKVCLKRTVDLDGFLEGYGYRMEADQEMDD